MTTKERRAQYMKEYYEKHKEDLQAYQHSYYVTHNGVGRRRLRNPEDRQRWNAAYTRRLRRQMLETYGGACVCCGERAVEFLTLDHINRDGAAHRAEIAGGKRRSTSSHQMYKWLRDRGWPKEGLRVLCMNCNWATRYGEACPHEYRYVGLDAWAAESVACS